MSREDPQLRVRIPAELKEILEQRAKENRRTLTAEIVSRLEATTVQDTMLESSNGFERLLTKHGNLVESSVELADRYDSLVDILQVDSNNSNDELRFVVARLCEILNRPEYK
ncbi:Arc family DNA-binding protein [Xenorhabdus bovienii]|uniref:Arc family DNA-binding protein n=1 Tax=Xenorhabdus bovienii TaxID=40576 RepID=UPI0004D88041|nr:Arc family DNA-binding protein [Xenorhabdus bovienii]CDG88424.1 hypothetical protein XBFFR1_2090021 [Xenorhabdus bovienii str. feltiae France]CDG93858.1 hypothetical protein XBFFL1_2750020 [Xenorhabdus bovienii str. feltiae Florida]